MANYAFAAYGDIDEIKGDKPIPPGWVIIKSEHNSIELRAGGLRPSKPSNIGTRSWIFDARGAAPGTKLVVCANSPIPSGWVIVESKIPPTLSIGLVSVRYEWAGTHTIELTK